MPNNTSPGLPSPCKGRENTWSKSKSLPAAVSIVASSVKARAGQLSLATLLRSRIRSSVARCWASAADPPLPQNIILPPARIARSQAPTTARTGPASSAKLSFSAAERRSIAANRPASVSSLNMVQLRRVWGKRACLRDCSKVAPVRPMAVIFQHRTLREKSPPDGRRRRLMRNLNARPSRHQWVTAHR